MNDNNKLWTRSYILNNVTCFILNVSYYLLMVIMTDYAVHSLDASLSAAGFATGSFIIGALIARLLMGGQIERIGLKLSAYIGVWIFLGGLIANFFVTNVIALSAVRIIQGIGFGIGSTTTGAIMARMVPSARRGEGTSYYAMFVTLATAIGPYAGGVFYNGRINTDVILSASLLIICLFCIHFVSIPKYTINSKPSTDKTEDSWIARFIEPKALSVAVITFLVSLGFGGILGFISTYERETGLTAAGTYFFIVYAVFTLISRPFTGRLFDTKGANFVMYPAFIIFGLGLLLLSVATTGWQLLLVAVCMGLGFGTFMSCAQAIVIMVSPKNKMGVATSTFFIFMDSAVGFGPSLMGLLIPSTGFRGLYLILAILQFVGAGLYFMLVSPKLKAMKKSEAVIAPSPSAIQNTGLVITISREFGSGGHEIGELLAKRLGIPCYDREIISKIVDKSHLAESLVTEEEQRINPSKLYRLYAWYAYSLPENGDSNIAERLFGLDKQIITDLAQKGSCVIIGRLANKILAGRQNVLNIFIHASKDSEAKRVAKRENICFDKAKAKVEKVNSERAAHCEYFTNSEWKDACNYDFTVNSDLWGIEGSTKLLLEQAQLIEKKKQA